MHNQNQFLLGACGSGGYQDPCKDALCSRQLSSLASPDFLNAKHHGPAPNVNAAGELKVGECCSSLPVNLSGAWLKYHDLTDRRLQYALLDGAQATGAVLRNADLRCASLKGTCLFAADLAGADLRDADLCSADLSWCDLTGASLSGANMIGALLYEADLSGAKLDGTRLDGAAFNLGTVWPQGFTPYEHGAFMGPARPGPFIRR